MDPSMTIVLAGHLGQTPVHEATLRSAAGAEAKIMTYGAVVRDLVVPGPKGMQRVVLGFPDFAPYPEHSPHFGAIAGRFANRIARGRFTLDGATHQLPLNQAGKHSLHGGGNGFGKRVWTIVDHDEASVTLALVSKDGDAGYPGTLTLFATYALAEPATLRMMLHATTDAATIVNLCHHSYFNLDGSPDILDHALEVRANLTTPVDADLIPNGALAPVAGTPFDFRVARPIRHMGADGARHWYDHNFVLRRDRLSLSVLPGVEIAQAATLSSAKSGLAMEVWTSEPAMQVYDGFKVSTPVAGLSGTPYGACAGICLEPQHVPDSPNLPHFPSTVLRPGEVYRQVTEYRFRPA
jgi:aldose 1-epimerase